MGQLKFRVYVVENMYMLLLTITPDIVDSIVEGKMETSKEFVRLIRHV